MAPQMAPQRSDSMRHAERARSANAATAAAPAPAVGAPSALGPLGQQVAFEFVDAGETLVEPCAAVAAATGAESPSAQRPSAASPNELTESRRPAASGASETQAIETPDAAQRHLRRPRGCWPWAPGQVRSCASARVADCRCAASGQPAAGKAGARARSESLDAELRRIEMHEKLLIGNQEKLFSELERELSPVVGAQHIALDVNKPLQMSPELARPASATQQQQQQQQPPPPPPPAPLAPLANAAVECRGLSCTAGLGPLQKTILHGVDLSVPEGSIYGLLGPSGCGKTTLLRCVAGRLEPSAGSIRVFGYEPGEQGSRIPGPAIGYMPQEISVYEVFTIGETLTYFGRINRMRAGVLRARLKFLLEFLNLPSKNRPIKTLSGGQKRRVSLAVALIHSPPLLILDEPTVGVDPLLRQIIWKYLVALASADKITIVITTHYIEEARQANVVGLMRAGRMLAEDRPEALMAEHQQASLENVFLRLCLITRELEGDDDQRHEDEPGRLKRAAPPLSSPAPTGSKSKLKLRPMAKGQKYAPARADWCSWLAILVAVTWKNYLRLRRNPPVILFEFILPAFQALLFCLCIGGDPFDISLAIVNEESVPQASRLFLNSISKTTFTQVPYDNLSAAIESVQRGHTWAAVHIPEAYTRNLNDRLLHPADVTNETIANGTIQIYPDLTNLHLALTIQDAFKVAFEKFSRETLDLFGYDTQLAELPIRMAKPVYGTLNKATGGYLEFMAPGVIISITYVMATGLTALAFVLEKRDGLLERSQVSGVTTSQILMAHALLQVFVMVFQIGLVLAVTFYVFKIPSRGPFAWVVLLVLLQGCTGMAFGLLISAVCSEENTAVMLLVGTFYINLILAGIIWPVEAMPRWLRLFSYAQPQTLPTEGLRNILSRGWSIDEPSIQYAFLLTIGWLVVFLLGAGLCMRYIK